MTSCVIFKCKNCTFDNMINSYKCELCFEDRCSTTLEAYLDEYKYAPRGSYMDKIKIKLQTIFTISEWMVLNSRGNGLCLINAVYRSLDLKTDFRQDLLQEIVTEITSVIGNELLFQKSNGKIIYINSHDTIDIINEKLTDLLDDNNLGESFIRLLSKNQNINILVLTSDSRSKTPFVLQYYKSELPDPKHLILLNVSGHYISLYHTYNSQFKENKINEIIERKLW